MATPLEIKRAKLELSSIRYGRDQTIFRIQEFQDNIDALIPTLAAQELKEAELVEKIKQLESESK